MLTFFSFLFYWLIILKYNYSSIKILTTLIYIIFLIYFIISFLQNPGIPGREYYKDTFRFKSEEDKLNYQQCTACNIIIPKSFKIIHCYKCGICIIKGNHHCPWIGKCVGENNLKHFLLFFLSLIGYIIMLFVSLITCFVYLVKNKK